jgi:uncharacterized membrane protein HdeD (DUF308 family)
VIEHREQGKASDAWTKAAEMERFRRREVWPMRLGIALILLGTVALGSLRAADSSGASPMLFGWLLVVGGLMEAVHAFHKRNWGGFLLHLMPCVAGVPIGLLIATHPSAGGTAWMLLFASYFTIVGLFRTISAFWFKFPAWIWTAFEGIVSLLLAAVFWTNSPRLGLWVFGFSVGTSMILRGWSSIMFTQGVAHRRKSLQSHGRNDKHDKRALDRSGFAPS